MLFNSAAFAVFMTLVFAVWWMPSMQHVRRRNLLIILTGSFFYGCWDIRFLLLLYFTATVDFFIAKYIERTEHEKTRKRLLLVSLLSNLSVLGFFKYFGFFADSFADLLRLFGMQADYATLNIVLPVGISFYTFQALSYTIDVYRKRVPVVHEWNVYYAYITFFPQMVAGPIARAAQLIPQLRTITPFHYQNAVLGMRLILWGLFQKCVIADNLSVIADNLFHSTHEFTSAATFVGVLAFSVQIYCDFAGYSNIARGTARLLGINLIENFRRPYFAQSLTDFWQRWHISMSSWFRDYVYIPLGGKKSSEVRMYFNLLITFLVSGLWHGAGWCFVFWGAWHGTALIIERYFSKHGIKIRGNAGRVWTLIVVFCSWIVFRSPHLDDALKHFSSLFAFSSDGVPLSYLFTGNWTSGLFAQLIVACTLFMFFAEYLIERKKEFVLNKHRVVRWSGYWVAIALLFLLGVYQAPPAFIYFQF